MLIDISASLGLEKITLKAIELLIENLEGEMEAQEASWHEDDKAFASMRGVAYEKIILEKIHNENIYKGHKPSLIEAPIDKYPNISVMAYQSGTASDQTDQLNSYENVLYVELMCKATETEGRDPEEMLNSRTSRTLDAIVSVIVKNSTLDGLVQPVFQEPEATIMNIFKRSEHTSTGEPFLWQGARLDYVFNKISDF